MWVRGLKLKQTQRVDINGSRILCGCVDWNCKASAFRNSEIRRILCGCVDWNIATSKADPWFDVASYVGAWIETNEAQRMSNELFVASYVGAWIETDSKGGNFQGYIVASYVGAWIETILLTPLSSTIGGRILCGCVDWNTEPKVTIFSDIRSHPMWVRGLKLRLRYCWWPIYCVASYVGAWIETVAEWYFAAAVEVASYVGAWIETTCNKR